jgi:hypothetical protein
MGATDGGKEEGEGKRPGRLERVGSCKGSEDIRRIERREVEKNRERL